MAGPRLELEWEEGLFRLLLGLWRRLRPAPPPLHRPEAAAFADAADSLRVFASLLAGSPLRLVPARGEGGLRAGDLLVPAHLDLGGSAADNAAALRLRLAIGATIRRRGLDRTLPEGAGPQALAALMAGRAAADHLCAELPAFGALHARLAAQSRAQRPPGSPAWDALRAEALDLSRPFVPPAAPPPGDPGPPLSLWGALVPAPPPAPPAEGEGSATPSQGQARPGKPVDQIERVVINEERAREKVVQHVFEKVETLDEHRGQEQRMDGADELDDHAEALDELHLSQVIRGGERADSLYRAEVGLDLDVPDVSQAIVGEAGLPYDEWDGGARRYRPGWCTVYPTALGGGDPAWAALVGPRLRPLTEALHRRLLLQRTQRRPVGRQTDGEDIDLDAVIDDVADRLAGFGDGQRLYTRALRRRRNVATTVLLDVSLSSDAWVADRRVLDLCREAALVLGEVADRLGDPLQILAFASHTRNRCRTFMVRDWGEPWSRGRARLGALRPQGYTRIGPALRHATATLRAVPADRRLLLLISDGQPTDTDRYEGRYGVADVRQALREAAQQGVTARALAVDAVARAHLPAMFGPGGYQILADPRTLPEALTTLYGRLSSP